MNVPGMNVPGMNDQRDLDGLSALVTGATSGVGRAVRPASWRPTSPTRLRWITSSSRRARSTCWSTTSGLGVRRLRDVERDEICWTTFADIEGNEFDLIAG